MQVIIDAPHFYVMYDMETGRIAPIIQYMKGWTLEQIQEYCDKKKWKLTVIKDKEPEVWNYDYDSGG